MVWIHTPISFPFRLVGHATFVTVRHDRTADGQPPVWGGEEGVLCPPPTFLISLAFASSYCPFRQAGVVTGYMAFLSPPSFRRSVAEIRGGIYSEYTCMKKNIGQKL